LLGPLLERTVWGPTEKLKRVRRFSFQIDLTNNKKLSEGKKPKKKSSAPPVADGFEMSGDLQQRRQNRRAWPGFQRELMALPELVGTTQEWDDPNLAAEFVRVYEVTKKKVVDAEPGFKQDGKMETHCFFATDGTKHVVSRLSTRPHQRINEIRLSLDGQLVRIHYENSEGATQSLEDLFDSGLLGLEDDLGRFRQHPNYVMRFFLLLPDGEYLNSTFRGVCYYDHESDSVRTEEAQQIQ
jgi:hypothetical protein